jgi:hypothetical protein
MQEERDFGRLEQGMEVCDVLGDKFGSVSRVHRREICCWDRRDERRGYTQ